MKNPYANTPAAKFINARINEISHRKSQQEMAREAGFKNSNMITQIKLGSTKLAFDRVPGMAKALEVDPALLMRLTMEQSVGTTAAAALIECFGSPVTENEQGWLEELRDASDDSDPRLAGRARTALRGIFGK
jgi:transcriptional regulator with XRE-family HTH domain